jgi:predicted NAD-dependent protein-ADP-ribosyltransferase YbiA (DUF1768 family)
MVLSKINKSVEYPDTMKIENNDMHTDKELYQIELFGVDILFTIGEPINTYYKQKIIYMPIYLIKNNYKSLQIGVYEFDNRKIDSTLYADELLIDWISKTSPLIYSFVDRDFILKMYLSPEKYEHEEKQKTVMTQQENDENITNFDDIFKVKTKKVDILPTETARDAKTYRKNYASNKFEGGFWINNFMTNGFYRQIQNEGRGDCFFASVRDSYKSIGMETTVANLRQLVSDRVSFDQFNIYKTLYEDNKEELKKIKNSIEEKKREIQEFTKRLNSSNSEETQRLRELIRDLKIEIKELSESKNISNDAISNYKFMKNIHTLDDLKEFIKTSEYWADEWSIGQLEVMLKVKFIIFLEESYKNKDLLNVIQCQAGYVDVDIERNRTFEVKYYMMMNYGYMHYTSISYKGKSAFTFSELPYDVKVMIADKCLERMSGIFSYIKEFVDFKNEVQRGGGDDDETDGQIMEELYQFGKKKMWDDDVKLYFYNNSSDVMPGKSLGEKMPKNKMKSFSKLSKIKNWRKKLDNYWVQPFILDDKTWASVEHYFQGSKFKNDNPKFYEKFSIDSKSSLSKNPAKARELGENKNKRPDYVEIDRTYDKTVGNVNMYTAQEAKFSQHKDLTKTLLATNNANLYYHRKGKHPIQSTNLMLIRKNLNDL